MTIVRHPWQQGSHSMSSDGGYLSIFVYEGVFIKDVSFMSELLEA